MTEIQESRALARKVLDRINADPDDDLAMLSRQLLRSDEHIEAAAVLLCNLAQIIDVVKVEWDKEWSDWDQEQRDAITRFLEFYYRKQDELANAPRRR